MSANRLMNSMPYHNKSESKNNFFMRSNQFESAPNLPKASQHHRVYGSSSAMSTLAAGNSASRAYDNHLAQSGRFSMQGTPSPFNQYMKLNRNLQGNDSRNRRQNNAFTTGDSSNAIHVESEFVAKDSSLPSLPQLNVRKSY